jgi:hypothetical protein
MVVLIGSLYASREYRGSKKVGFDAVVLFVGDSKIVQVACGDLLLEPA